MVVPLKGRGSWLTILYFSFVWSVPGSSRSVAIISPIMVPAYRNDQVCLSYNQLQYISSFIFFSGGEIKLQARTPCPMCQAVQSTEQGAGIGIVGVLDRQEPERAPGWFRNFGWRPSLDCKVNLKGFPAWAWIVNRWSTAALNQGRGSEKENRCGLLSPPG